MSAPQSAASAAAAAANGNIDLSLHRIVALLARLGNPQQHFPVIHVAGTNAKGSTIAYLDAILRNVVGVRTGTFTSPHLVTPRDSCRVGGNIVDEATWDRAGALVGETQGASGHVRHIDNGGGGQAAGQTNGASAQQTLALECTPFEVLTARCFVAFLLLPPAERPDVLLIEVGMGGATDATNVFTDRQVLASVIGVIDLDHQSFLGDTLGKIAAHKAGIIKQGGLCVLADQRRGFAASSSDVDVTRVSAAATRSSSGNEDAAITDAVRQASLERGARLVKSYVPWQALEALFARENGQQGSSRSAPSAAGCSSNVRFSPILMPSRLRPGDFVAATGDAVVPGPTLQLPATRAALTGAHLALQTLWSIARDESPCGLGMAGTDVSEELRLAIAFALRDDPIAHRAIQRSIEQVQLAGRAEWRVIVLPPHASQMQAALRSADGMDVERQETPPVALQVLVDGAHNPSAAVALRQYVDSCVAQWTSDEKARLEKEHRLQNPSLQVTVTWVLSFSQGKDVNAMLASLIGPFAEDDVHQRMANVTLSGGAAAAANEGVGRGQCNLKHRIASVAFSTPVEGMPWIHPVDPSEIALAAQSLAQQHRCNDVVEARSFPNEAGSADIDEHARPLPLLEALRWALEQAGDTGTQHDPAGTLQGSSSHMFVIAGSLYLVSDVHRLQQQLSAQSS